MKNSKFKIISIFCAFSLLGVLTISVNAMEKKDNGNKENFSNINSNINENCINQLQDDFNFKVEDFFNERSDNAVNESNYDKENDRLENNKLFDYLCNKDNYISDKNYDELNEYYDYIDGDDKKIEGNEEFDYLNFETKDSLNEIQNYETDKNSVLENNEAKAVDANNKKIDITEFFNKKNDNEFNEYYDYIDGDDKKIKGNEEFDYLNFETKDSLNEIQNYETDKNSVLENNEAKAVDANNKKIDICKELNLEGKKLKDVVNFIPTKYRINLNNNFKNSNNLNNYGLYNNFNNYNLYNNRNFINFNMLLYQNNFYINNYMKIDNNIGSTFKSYKFKFIDVLKRINELIDKVNENKFDNKVDQLTNKHNNFFSEYKTLFSNYNEFLGVNEYKIYNYYKYKCEIGRSTEAILERLKVLSELIELKKDSNERLKFYKEEFQKILDNLKSESNIESKSKAIEEYENLYKDYFAFLKNRSNIIKNNNLKEYIFILINDIYIKRQKDEELKIFESLVFDKKIFDDSIGNLKNIIDKKNYEDRDPYIKHYDYWWHTYEKFYKENKNKIIKNNEIFEMNEEVNIKKKIGGVIRNLICDRMKFDGFLKDFERLKENFNQVLFNMKKDDYKKIVSKYKESIESDKEIIDKLDYLKILKQEIFDIINDIDKKIPEIELKNIFSK